MKENTLNYFALIGKIQSIVSKASSLDEALDGGVQEILKECDIDNAIVWYMEESDHYLHPYYWIGPFNFMDQKYEAGQGVVGTVYQSQQSLRYLDYPNCQHIDDDLKDIGIVSMATVPLSNKFDELGCIQFFNTTEGKLIGEEAVDTIEILAYMIGLSIDENTNIQKEWTKQNVLMSVRDIKKDFQSGETISHVLKGINLDIYEGEFVVLLGESGCGKSTLMNIMSGMDSATSGTVQYMDKDISKASQSELTEFRRDYIGYIFQSYNLMPNLNIKQNLDLIGELVKNPMDSMEALKLVGLDQKYRSYPSQLSGGQQQRVSIARALVKAPKIIMADEPTAALDYKTSIEVLSVMAKIVEQGTTLVMVTHNEEITRMCDRVVRFRDGRVYEVTINRHPVPAEELVW